MNRPEVMEDELDPTTGYPKSAKLETLEQSRISSEHSSGTAGEVAPLMEVTADVRPALPAGVTSDRVTTADAAQTPAGPSYTPAQPL